MITSIKFENGQPFLTNRFVKTKGYLEEKKINKFIYRGVFGTQKNGGILNNALDLKFKNIANTHVVKLGHEILALWEAAGPHAMDPDSLETIGLTTWVLAIFLNFRSKALFIIPPLFWVPKTPL